MALCVVLSTDVTHSESALAQSSFWLSWFRDFVFLCVCSFPRGLLFRDHCLGFICKHVSIPLQAVLPRFSHDLIMFLVFSDWFRCLAFVVWPLLVSVAVSCLGPPLAFPPSRVFPSMCCPPLCSCSCLVDDPCSARWLRLLISRWAKWFLIFANVVSTGPVA